MNNFEYMFDKLPAIMQKENVKKYYMSIASIFDLFDIELEKLNKVRIIDFANGKDLDRLGTLLNISRGTLNEAQYRSRIKIFYFTYYFVPNLNNFLFLINNLLGYTPTNVIEGWTLNGANKESGVLKIDIIIPPSGDDSTLINLDKIFSAGVRLDWKKIQEAYLVSNMTGDYDNTGIINIYDWILKTRIGNIPGINASTSTGREYTNENIPYDIFEGGE